MRSMIVLWFFFLFFLFLSLLVLLLYQNSHPRKITEATSQKKEGRDRKSRQVRARTTKLQGHAKVSCKKGYGGIV